MSRGGAGRSAAGLESLVAEQQAAVASWEAARPAGTAGSRLVFVADAGYHSEANLTAPGPDRLIADGKTRDLARREPAEGPPPDGATAIEANAPRLATP